MPLRETLKLFWRYCKHEMNILRTPLGLTALIIAAILSMGGIVVFIAYHGTVIELIRGFSIELFGAAVIFMTVELLWPSFLESYRKEYGTDDLPYNQELEDLRDEVRALRSLLEQRLPENKNLTQGGTEIV